jgi:predicted GNAT superfamily acetyltransferase
VPVSIRCLESLDELAQVGPLFEKVWGATGFQVAMPVNLLRALAHSGNYVSGAFADGRLVGAGVGWVGEHNGAFELHSHAVGVDRATQGQGVGFDLKLHQKRWAQAKSIDRITWTFDPLGRRNAWFNLAKLGARAVAYYPNFYGIMPDDLNGTDETDRCLIAWELSSNPPLPPVDAPVVLLTESADHTPIVNDTRISGANALRCQVPDDIVSLRQGDAALGREWRLALRATMGRAMREGFVATSMTRDGWYVLERPV